VRLERLGEGIAAHSGETVASHWVDEPGAEASTSGGSGAAPESSVVAYGMEDVVHALMGEPYSGLYRKALTEASKVRCCFPKTIPRMMFSSCHSSPSL
jgi:hypothetical protein